MEAQSVAAILNGGGMLALAVIVWLELREHRALLRVIANTLSTLVASAPTQGQLVEAIVEVKSGPVRGRGEE